MSYVMGFVVPVPTANKEAYLRHAAIAAEVLKENGALRVVEAWGDDVPEGDVTSYRMAVKLEAEETVVYGWVEWPSRAMQEIGMEAAMQDPRMSGETNPMPFDAKRLIYGGFEVIVDS